MAGKIVALIGSYRKGGIIDQAVTEILRAAEDNGAQTGKIYLSKKRIEFCVNCRNCTQAPGVQRGKCVQSDDLEALLSEIDSADAIVLGAPVNFFNVNALTRKFMERLVCHTYWPWGQLTPHFRIKNCRKLAVWVTSSAMPGCMVGLLTGAPRALKLIARVLGARPVGSLVVGLAAGNEDAKLPAKAVRKARALGRMLAKRSRQ